MVGADFTGQFFQDRFLIADMVMKADFPTERWFWFDPPFHRNQSVLLHKQCDNVWRIDFQLGWDTDPRGKKREEKVIPRIQAMLGPGVEFELEWASRLPVCLPPHRPVPPQPGDFCRRRGAHQVSPFGARGANTGVQDCDNLTWKLAAVMTATRPWRCWTPTTKSAPLPPTTTF
jgi:3-(3-hydroxy-phenyl)propionate hydroxylase